MQKASDILIIGGGVIGCAIAYALRKDGREVSILESGEIGAQASSAAAGLLAPLGPLAGPGPFADLLLVGFRQIIQLVPELEDVSGIAIGYAQTGALRTVRNPKRVIHLQKHMADWQPLGLQVSWLSGDEARRREPSLAPDICAAIYAPEEAQLHAAQVTQAFAQSARALGAQLYEHSEVVGIQHSGARVMGVLRANQETLPCNHLIVATGAWSALCGEWLNLALPVRPLRGQMLALQQPDPPLQHLIFGDAAYLASRGEQIFVGATKDDVGFDTRTTAEGITWLQNVATRLLPALATSKILKTWAGLRPKTPDTRPIIGPAPGWENVTLATGHNSVGIMLSAITGQTIAEYLNTGHIPPIIQPFGAERFQEMRNEMD